jgi:elongation factor Ts
MNESFVKMATEMANQALNFDTKDIFLASVSTESLLLIN